MPKHIAIFPIDLERGGVTVNLLNNLRWLKLHTDWNFSVIVPKTGVMADDFRPLAELVFVEGNPRPGLCCKPDLLLFDSVSVLARLVGTFPKEPPRMFRVHELNFAIDCFGGPKILGERLSYFKSGIAVSRATAKNLMDSCGIASEVVYEALDVAGMPAQDTSFLRRSLNLPDKTILVGYNDIQWRKGSDLFVQMAGNIMRENPNLPVHFVVLGVVNRPWEICQMKYDIDKLGLNDRFSFVPFQANPGPYQAGLDIFVLSSREEPCGICALETAAYEHPIVCFQDAGGIPEIVENDAGFCVPYLDVGAMAKAVTLLVEDPHLRATMGQTARRKVLERCDVSVIGPQLVKIFSAAM